MSQGIIKYRESKVSNTQQVANKKVWFLHLSSLRVDCEGYRDAVFRDHGMGHLLSFRLKGK